MSVLKGLVDVITYAATLMALSYVVASLDIDWMPVEQSALVTSALNHTQ